jgi:chorismate--pyruvate lyase
LPNISHLFTRPPLWKSQLRGSDSQPPAALRPWLDETGSLTKRLRSVYGKNLAVKLLFHHWKPAFAEECRQLKVPHHRYQLIREVLLHIGDTPLVLARTVLPEHTIRIAHRNLSHLGTRPLGEVIFAYPDLELRQRYFSQAAPSCWSTAIQNQFQIEPAIWGRRTLYAIHHQPLLVSEFFLPAMLQGLTTQKP